MRKVLGLLLIGLLALGGCGGDDKNNDKANGSSVTTTTATASATSGDKSCDVFTTAELAAIGKDASKKQETYGCNIDFGDDTAFMKFEADGTDLEIAKQTIETTFKTKLRTVSGQFDQGYAYTASVQGIQIYGAIAKKGVKVANCAGGGAINEQQCARLVAAMLN